MLPIGPIIGIPNVDGGAESAPAIPLAHASEASAFATLFTTSAQPASANPIILAPTTPVATDFSCLAQVETDEMIDALAATNRATARGITMRMPMVNPLVIHIEAVQQPLLAATISEIADTQVSGAEPLDAIDTGTMPLSPLAFALPIEPVPIPSEIETLDIENVIAVQSDSLSVNGESAAIHNGDALQHLEASKTVTIGDNIDEPDRPIPVSEMTPQADRVNRERVSSDVPVILDSKPLETPAPQPQNNPQLVQSTSLDGMNAAKIPDADMTPKSIAATQAPFIHSADQTQDLSEVATEVEKTETIKSTENVEGQRETQTQILADATRVDSIAASFKNLLSNPEITQTNDQNVASEDIRDQAPPQASTQQPAQAPTRDKLVARLASHEQGQHTSGTLDAPTVADAAQRLTRAPNEPASNPLVVAVSLPQQGDGASAIRGVQVQDGEQDRPRDQEMAQDADSDQRDQQGRNGREQVKPHDENESKLETKGSDTHQQGLREEFRNVLKDIELKTGTTLEGMNGVITEPALPHSDGQTTTSARAIAGEGRFSPMTETGSSETRAQANEMRMRALERQIGNAVKEGSDTIRMQLYPPGLGQVVIRLTAEGGRLRMISRTQSQEASDALRQIEHDLRNALGSDGIQLTEFDVSDHNDGDGRRHMQEAKLIINRSAKAETFAIDMNA